MAETSPGGDMGLNTQMSTMSTGLENIQISKHSCSFYREYNFLREY